MPRRNSKPANPLRTLGVILASALLLFVLAEAYRYVRSEGGRLALAQSLGLGEPAEITRLVSKRLRVALARAGVAPDSISERIQASRYPQVTWRVGIQSDASLLQTNYVLSRMLEAEGAAVLSGRESWDDHGQAVLALRVGLPRRATHNLEIVRAARSDRPQERDPVRLALVLFGFGEDAARADSFFSLPVPFAVAVLPGAKGSRAIFRAAREGGREMVLHLPLEPINYPQVNPGPGTLLVTMKPSRIAGEVRRHLAEAEPVAAVANHMGSLATQDMTLMRAVYLELRRRDLPFLHVTPVAGAVCKPLAAEMGVVYGEPDAVVDRETRADVRALDRRWRELLAEAQKRGRLTVWMRATPLAWRWLPQALTPRQLGDVHVVPLSALLRKSAAL
jgi:polysaccharide deacetylase 2 family uncharacterized protein YibQ